MELAITSFPALSEALPRVSTRGARPLARTLKSRPLISPDSQWASFLRNHDELTLDKLTEKERQEVFAAFGPAPEMQLFGRGLRRRLPLCSGGTRDGVLLHNPSSDPCTVPVEIQGCNADHRLVDLLRDGVTNLDENGFAELALEGYGYRWLRLMSDLSRRLA